MSVNDVKRLEREEDRDHCIDYLRTIGIFLIIMAHCYPPEWLKSIRIFDVVLLVFASGMSYACSKEIKTVYDYGFYVWKRIKRLLFPAWAFVAIYMLWLVILNLNGASYNLSFRTIVLSATLVEGVGYVWIIRIFLCMAIIAPFLKIVSNKIEKDKIYITLVLGGICIYLLILSVCRHLNYSGHIKMLIDKCILPIFGYAIVYSIGMRCRQMSSNVRIFMCVVLFFVYFYFCLSKGMLNVLSDKYPPGPQYLTYGIVCSLLLFFIFLNISDNPFVTWTSMHSLEVYYTHCFVIAFMDAFLPELQFLNRYAIALAFSFGVSIIYVKIRMLMKQKAKI